VTIDLDRFRLAQQRDYEQALAELAAGRKRSHWIWYIFPQLAGLGRSPMAQTYGLQGIGEASAYLADPLLRSRLLAVSNAVRANLDHEPPAALRRVMGSEIDAVKLVSSMTLFREIARRAGDDEMASVADAILAAAKKQGFAECTFTQTYVRRAL
jgi:uncharacterized protein (DUF1810 family)